MAKIDSEKLVAHLKEKWGNSKCPMCQEGVWGVQDRVFELREYHGGSMKIGGSALVPIVPVTCENCGNTVLVNAIAADVLDKEAKENE